MKIIFDHSKGHVTDDKVFCEVFCIPEDESPDDLLSLGWLPYPSFEIPYWYQSQSCRINSSKINLSYKRRKVISEINFEIKPYNSIKDEVDLFFKNFFSEKTFELEGPYESTSVNPDIQILKMYHKNEVIGYTRFQIFDQSILGFETSYNSNFPKLSLGKTLIIILAEYGKSIGKQYTYIYESYKDYFPYKLEITGAEYFEGEYWK